ncbi:MFS transporter [Frondihabitans peucedani]|uniref:MFS transporter n=1 Tax=Frondihabitans peucedani TaxID=598626 RepID=A0ABP8E3Y7_9MICO
MTRRRAVGSLAALLTAHALSQTGNVVTLFAVPFAVLATGGGPVQVGVASFVATVPIVIGGPLGGVLVGRIGYKRSSILADVVNGAAIVLIPILAVTVGLPFWALLGLVFVGGLLDTPGQTARRVLVPDISGLAGVRLERSVGFIDAATRLSGLIGAPLAGILVAALGPFEALYATAAGFALSALVTVLLVDAPVSVTASDEVQEGYWADLRAGFRAVVHDPLLRILVALVLVTNLLDAARSNTLLPLYADQRLGGAGALGWIVACFGGSALVGSVLFGFVAHRVPRRVTFSVCFVLAGGPSLCVFALGLPVPWLIAGMVVSGLAAGSLNPILGAVQFERIPEHLRARVFGLLTAAAWAGVPLGGLLGGFAASAWGVSTTFGIVGVIYVGVCLAPLSGGRWRLMEKDAIQKDRVLA